MTQFTRRAIIATFIELLNERPLDKITVNEIVQRCGVNRNTFYYYYQDIYALIDEIFQAETARISEDTNDFSSWSEAFLAATHFARENKRAIYHIYHSVSRERLEEYLYGVTRANITRFVRSLSAGLTVADGDVQLIADFYTYALVGQVLEWLNHGMKTDQEQVIERAAVLFDGSIRRALEHADPRHAASENRA